MLLFQFLEVGSGNPRLIYILPNLPICKYNIDLYNLNQFFRE